MASVDVDVREMLGNKLINRTLTSIDEPVTATDEMYVLRRRMNETKQKYPIIGRCC